MLPMFRKSVMDKLSEITKMYNLIGRERYKEGTVLDYEVKLTENFGKLADGRWCLIDTTKNEVLYFENQVSPEAIYVITKLTEVYGYLYSKEYGRKAPHTDNFDY